MWPAAPPTSAPLMQPLASAVAVCAVSRSVAVTAANTNFIRILLLGRLLNETRQREVPTIPTIDFVLVGSRQSEMGQRSGTADNKCVSAWVSPACKTQKETTTSSVAAHGGSMCRDRSPLPVLQNQRGGEKYLRCDWLTLERSGLCRSAGQYCGVATYAQPFVARVIEFSFSSPDLRAASTPPLSNRDPLSSVSTYE